MLNRPAIALLILSFLVVLVVGQDRVVRVDVHDTAGSRITNAAVKIAQDSSLKRCLERGDAYYCDVKAGLNFIISIEANTFRGSRIDVNKDANPASEYIVVLQPAGIEETVITVGRTESRIADTPESISDIGKTQLQTTAAPMLDDTLRQVPGFSIFRRSSSRNANPTTQGVSLRGVGASGASRTLVMLDGVPLNDPFGGWVQWNRVSPISVESVEVLRGGASSLYGNSSLSGAIDLRTRSNADKIAISAETFGGSQRTLSGSVFAGGKYKGWSGDVSGGHFQTRGFIPVDEDARGPVDSFAGVRSENFSGRFGREFGSFLSFFVRPSYFGESRTNGTPAQTNRTHSRQLVFGGTINHFDKIDVPKPAVTIDWRLFGGTQMYDQTFSSVAADRITENLTRVQRSPSQHFGYSVQVSASIKTHTLVGGFEGREVRGSSSESIISNGKTTSLVGAGGRERTIGAFVKDIWSIGKRTVLSGTIRYDAWREFRGSSVTKTLSNSVVIPTVFPDRDDDAFSPQASVLFRVNDTVALNAVVSKSFRSPTLNELYRSFRVGNVLTTANADLKPETATNAETGVRVFNEKYSVRTTVFLTEIDNAIANVTLSTTPSLITRQRQNAGKTRSAGIEIDAETRIGKLDLNAGYLFADSRVTEFPSNPMLVYKFIPQVPQHQFTFQTRYPIRGFLVAFQGRASSKQYDDDLNLFRLEPYFQLDAFVSKRFKEKFTAFVSVENLFNSRYSTGRTPVQTVSAPISGRIGIRRN